MDAMTDIARTEGLAEVVSRARRLLDQGDIVAARLLASGAYDRAKADVQFAKRAKASRQLRDKARRLQGDALLIEALSKMEIAREWDAAQKHGQASSGGRPAKAREDGKTVPDENGFPASFTAEEAGISRKDIHEGRKLAEAVRRTPGLVEQAIEARLAQGFEPSRANLRAAVGTASATKEDRGQNLYETPEAATRTLLALESFSPTIWEPSCGRNAIGRVFEQQDYAVDLSDLVDYGTADSDGVVQRVEDFLTTKRGIGQCCDIVTNPPYGGVLNAYVAHALREHQPRKMALLLNLNFLCGFADEDRNFVMDEMPPARIWVFTRRLPMMHRDGWDGPKASSRMNTAWFVWERQPDGGYGDTTVMKRVDWKGFQAKEGEVE